MKNLIYLFVIGLAFDVFGFVPAGCPDLTLPRPAEVTYDAAGRPSDAEILFDGKDLSAWRSMDGGPARWPVQPDGTMKVDKTGNTPDKVVASIYTRSVYTNFQLHVEFRIPEECAKESSQWRGNSGVKIFGCYEVQILDSYRRDSYANGLCGALYCNWPPAVVASKPLGEWQSYDIVFHAPVVADGVVKERATFTVFQNGVVVQDHVHTPPYPKTEANELRACGDIELQSHNDASAPISFRNVWIRRLPPQERLEEEGWRQWLAVPAKYADFKREARPTAKYAFSDFDVECYEQRNGTDTVQRVMMAIPKNAKGKCPAVVAPFYFPEATLGFNPADGGLESDLAADGTNLTFYSEVAYMSDLARRGYITISADAYYLNYPGCENPWWRRWTGYDLMLSVLRLDSGPWPRLGEIFRRDWPEWTGIGKLTFDTRLLVDLLCADKRVDASRIGIIGHSLGGKMAFYAGCLDPRIKVIVASDFGIGWDQTNWDADWYWGSVLEEVRAQGFDNSVLLEASGGKPFCLIAGKYDNEDSGRAVRRARQYGQTPSLFKFVNHATGHRPPRWATEEGYRFLDQHLKCKSNKEEKK